MHYLVDGKLIQMEEDTKQVMAVHKTGDKLILEQKIGGWEFRGETGILGKPTKGEAIKEAINCGYEIQVDGKKLF